MTTTSESIPTTSDAPVGRRAVLPVPLAPGYAALDAWRGIAALMVVVFHATATYRGHVDPPVGSLADVCWQSLDLLWLGVQLFFVISGYCIAAAVDAARRKPAPVGTFAARRLKRIYPTFVVWLALMALALGVVGWIFPEASFWSKKSRFLHPSEMSWFDWLTNLTLTHTWLPGLIGAQSVSVTEVSWTLCYEVQFYFVCGALLALAPRFFFPFAASVTLLLAILFLADSATGQSHRFRGSFLDGRWLQFAMGIGVYYVLNYGRSRAQWTFAAFLAGIAVVSWIAHSNLTVESSIVHKNLLELSFCGMFGAALVALKSCDGRVRNTRPLSPLMKCGKISYSLYLVHWPFCKVVSTVLWGAGVQSLTATLCVTTPICVAVSLGAAALYFQLVERRFIHGVSERATVRPESAVPLIAN